MKQAKERDHSWTIVSLSLSRRRRRRPSKGRAGRTCARSGGARRSACRRWPCCCRSPGGGEPGREKINARIFTSSYTFWRILFSPACVWRIFKNSRFNLSELSTNKGDNFS